jgi:phage baseplate assembly protein W
MAVTKTLPDLSGGSTAQLGENWHLQFIQPDGLPLTMAGLEIIDFGAISYKEIFQNVKTILATPLFSAALERTLGLDQTIVDRPITQAAAITVAIITAVSTWEPRQHIMNIDFQADAINGHLVVLLQLDIKNVIYGTNTPYTATNINPPVLQLPPMNEPVPGPPGPPGPAGPRGSLWFVGATDPPAAGFGPSAPQLQDQDMYLNTVSGDVFQYSSTGTGTTATFAWKMVKKGQ